MSDAQTVLRRCDALAACTEEPGRVTRPYGTEAMRRAQDLVALWMRQAGMQVRRDNIGNVIGRHPGARAGDGTLLLGSHIDSVRDAGRYDGPLGVVVAIAAVERLQRSGRRLPFTVEVLAFAEEEGLRFGTHFMASRAVAGTFEARDLERRDADGVTLAEAIRSSGGDPDRIALDRWSGTPPLGYVEVHIEQGPVLEALGRQVGVVDAISGQSHLTVTFTGEAGHAGTVPMERRHDALVAASRFVIAVDATARGRAGTVATVGLLHIPGAAANVVPGRVEMVVDVRHAVDGERTAACAELEARAQEIATGSGIAVEVRRRDSGGAVACSPRLSDLLERAAGTGTPRLSSGAGHDAVAMSELCEVAMLFVRCRGGISHHPAESVEADDVAVSIDVLVRFLELLA